MIELFFSKLVIAHVISFPSTFPNHNKPMGYAIIAWSGLPRCFEICYSAFTEGENKKKKMQPPFQNLSKMKRGANHIIGKGETSGTWSTEFRKWNSKKKCWSAKPLSYLKNTLSRFLPRLPYKLYFDSQWVFFLFQILFFCIALVHQPCTFVLNFRRFLPILIPSLFSTLQSAQPC